VRALIVGLVLALSGAAHAEEDSGTKPTSAEDYTPENVHKVPPTPAQVRATVRTVLASKPLSFCSTMRACLHRDQVAWCEHLDREACPGLAAACAAKPMRMCLGEEDEVEDTEPERDRSWRLPNLGGVGRWLFFGLLVFAVAWVVVAVLRNRRWGTDAVAAVEPIEGADGAIPPLEAAARGPVETDVDRLLAAARAALAAGAPADAVQHAYAAIMRHLESRGLVEIEIWRTNGDYLRQLASQPELRREVAPLFAAIEQLQFGPRPPSHDEASALLTRAARIAGRLLAFTLLVAGVLGGCGRFGARSGEDGPGKRSVLVRFLTSNGFHAEHRVTHLEKVPETDAIVLFPSAWIEPEQWTKLLSWVTSGGVLVIAGQTSLPNELPIKSVSEARSSSVAEVTSDYAESLGPLKLWIPGARHLETLGEGTDVLVRRGGQPYLVQRTIGKGVVLVLADGVLFTNGSLLLDENPTLLVELFGLLGFRDDDTKRKIQLVSEDVGDPPSSPAAALKRSALAPFMLQLGAFLAFVLLYRGVRFGAARDPRIEERRSFVEHVRALGLQLRRVRAGRYAFALYASWALDRLRAEHAEQRGLGQLVDAVAQRWGQPETLVRETLEHAQQARDDLAADRIGDEALDERSRIAARRLAEWTHRTGEAT
jgi:hypothetical protein